MCQNEHSLKWNIILYKILTVIMSAKFNSLVMYKDGCQDRLLIVVCLSLTTLDGSKLRQKQNDRREMFFTVLRFEPELFLLDLVLVKSKTNQLRRLYDVCFDVVVSGSVILAGIVCKQCQCTHVCIHV